MSLAMLSAISLICADVSLAALQQAIVDVAETKADQSPAPAASPAPPENISEPSITVEDSAEHVDEAEAEVVSRGEEYSGPLAFEGETDEAVVERFSAYLENTKTLSGDFTQIAPSGAITNGRFYLRRPGLLRFEYDPPTPLLVVANGGMVYVRDEALETTDSYPVGRTPLKFLLNKKVDLDDAKVIAVDRGVDNVAITFASNKDETEGELTLIASAPDMTLRRWIVRDLQNGITVVTLNNVKAGEKLANRLFRTPDAGGDFLKN